MSVAGFWLSAENVGVKLTELNRRRVNVRASPGEVSAALDVATVCGMTPMASLIPAQRQRPGFHAANNTIPSAEGAIHCVSSYPSRCQVFESGEVRDRMAEDRGQKTEVSPSP